VVVINVATMRGLFFWNLTKQQSLYSMGEKMGYLSTRQVAEILGVRPNYLQTAIWDGRISAPTKGPGNAFLWTESDIDRASWVLLRKPYKPTNGEDNGKN
jgi:hypothetical protein